MNPRLVAITGPLERTTFMLSEEVVSIGRDRSSLLWINDGSLSRRHSLIEKHSDQFKLTDLDSHNGTRVNGVPIRERFLKHGDLIAMGDSLFLFLLQEETDAPKKSSMIQLEEDYAVAQATIVLRTEDALYLHPARVLAALPPTARMARDLNTLLSISTINSARKPEAFAEQLLEAILEAFPSDRVALFLNESNIEELTPAFILSRPQAQAANLPVSRTVINRVLSEGVALLSGEVKSGKPFDVSESLRASKARSLLCVPMKTFEKVLGVIYLDTSDSEIQFDENHLQLLTAISSIAAVGLQNIRQLDLLEQENERLRDNIDIEHNMVGESARLRHVCQFMARVAPLDSTVLILGESGTGKELAASAIHRNSRRASGPFIPINCAALVENLLESELFGHEKGSFTGAIALKKGKLELADGGTLFLDEVGDIAPVLQVKLLRVLQEREFERVGGVSPIKVDIRLIAATNKDLEQAVKDGTFRQDLYYRLNVVSLKMPALRERREDIPLLANYFVTKYAQKCNRRVKGISAEARSYLMSYEWPGNVRELENAIERAVVLGTTETILSEDLPETILEVDSSNRASATGYNEAVKEAKKRLILNAMEQSAGNYSDAGKLLGIHPNNLHRLIRNLNLRPLLKN